MFLRKLSHKTSMRQEFSPHISPMKIYTKFPERETFSERKA